MDSETLRFKQIAVRPDAVYEDKLFALGEDGNVYVESHGVVDNHEISFWSRIDWQVSPHPIQH